MVIYFYDIIKMLFLGFVIIFLRLKSDDTIDLDNVTLIPVKAV